VATAATALVHALSSFCVSAHPDSGATGTITYDAGFLTNVRTCNETFTAAGGDVQRASCIGDMPVLALATDGAWYLITFRNVRCVPAFKYTLLSVSQMWAEQRIDARFADSRALVLPESAGGIRIAYAKDRSLPTIRMVSAARLLAHARAGGGRGAAASATLPAAALPAFGDTAAPPSTPAPAQAHAPAPTPAAATPSNHETPLSRLPSVSGASGSPPLLPTPLPAPSPLTSQHEAAAAPQPGGAVQPEAAVPEPLRANANAGRSSAPLGWHRIGSTSHIARLPAVQAAELIHRRSHSGVAKIRALPHTTSDAPKVLASASAVSCDSCAQARIKRESHSGSLAAPAPEPGVLHLDLKEMVISTGGYRYIVFLIDEHSRFVFYDFVKRKSEVMASVLRGISAFHATVGTPLDEDGRPLSRPRVRQLHSDREGGLMSHAFKEFRSIELIHHTVSPPHDHDLNPIAERIIGLTSELATAIRVHSHAPPQLWPWIVAYAVDWHNASVSAVGSSTADANISPHQRFTLVPPKVMDLASFGCRAIVLKPPTHQHKPSLTGRGWVGVFLGRSRGSKGSYDVLVDGRRVVTSSSVIVNEEYFDWAPRDSQHRPLTSVSHAAAPAQPSALLPDVGAPHSDVSAPATYSRSDKLRMLSVFSGPYARADGLAAYLRQCGWADVFQIDNDGERAGGWGHDLLNDARYAQELARASAGAFEGLMIAFPCSSSSIARMFDATNDDGGDRGPPVIRDLDRPDGLPATELDPKHILELRLSNLLLERVVNIAIAARRSPARTTIVFENPSDRSPGASIASAPEFAKHGAIFRTTPFKRLLNAVGLSHCTFAQCRLGGQYQKYTTLYYTAEAGAVLDALDSPDYACNHERGSHTRAGGRGPDGNFVSGPAAAYPARMNAVIARAFTVARTGSASVPSMPRVESTPSGTRRADDATQQRDLSTDATPPFVSPTSPPVEPSAAHGGTARDSAPITFPDLGGASAARRPRAVSSLDWSAGSPQSFGELGRAAWAPPTMAQSPTTASVRRSSRLAQLLRPQQPAQPLPLTPVQESSPSSPASDDGYVPFDATAADAMTAAIAESLYDASTTASFDGSSDAELAPISEWVDVTIAHTALKAGKRLPGGSRMIEIEVAIDGECLPTDSHALLAAIGHTLRADSPDAPDTHAEAMRRGAVWVKAESKELTNHSKNESWLTITRDELPRGRRVHKMIWVYKVKRDGTAKARLCVQGSSLEAGVDFQQVFSAALRYSSARGLFAYAARNCCRVRSVDLVAAYLQGRFLDGEVVYCMLPPGHVEYDTQGRPKLAKVQKPIYGIQQAGRRLQRDLFKWVKEQGFVQLDDSDPCIFKLETTDAEVLTIGIYVDNLQIVHSVPVDDDGNAPAGSAYASFMRKLADRWDVTDEGPMEDLLGIEVEYNVDGKGAIKLHQQKYVEKITSRFLPDGPIGKAQKNSMPYSGLFLKHINDSLSATKCEYPELLGEMQSRVGCLMYAATSTRPDVAYAVHQLCKCLHKPTPDLLRETDHVLSYLARNPSLGLTYTAEQTRLLGYADASWETAHSTSGWVVLWQCAALTWGSRKQKSIALSTCEAEIIALSEAAKDVVYLRKLVKGLDAREPTPSSLSTDSQSARDVSYNPEHHDRMKHVERRHFYVRDMVENFELVVPFVPTKENPADFFTKPMHNATEFVKFRRIVMNEP
jgi:hypothetical protein